MKKLLIVVDYQKDFVDGALGFKGAELLEDNICKRIIEFNNEGHDVVFTLDTHKEDYLKTIEGTNLPVVHCVKGTDGHRIYGKVEALAQDKLKIEKETFGSRDLGDYLKEHIYDQIELVGLVSNICVFSNAVICKTYQPNSRIIVWRDSASSFDLEMQEKGYDILRNLHIEVL